MKYFMVCGEHSADLYGARVMEYLKELDKDSKFLFTGGPKMEVAAGMSSLIPWEEMNIMGFWEVLRNLGKIRKHFRIVQKNILTFNPDAIILLDYPGFNLRLAKWAHRLKKRVFYFISPTVWAWKPGRAKIIRDCCRKLFCILPFEPDVYKRLNVHNVEFVGHPLIPEWSTDSSPHGFSEKSDNLPWVLLMPGSRKQEVKKHLPVMIELAKRMKNEARFVVSVVNTIPEKYYQPCLRNGITLASEPAQVLMKKADAGVIKSGTSSLQAMLSRLPHLVCYKAHPLSYFIARQLVSVSFISLVNLIPGKKIVREFIQQEFTAERLEEELRLLLFNTDYRDNMLHHFAEIKKHLHPFPEHPCRKVAQSIYSQIVKA